MTLAEELHNQLLDYIYFCFEKDRQAGAEYWQSHTIALKNNFFTRFLEKPF